jgi:hypothetical protein
MLHGDIRVNGKSIGYWTARNTRNPTDTPGHFWYMTEFYMDDQPRVFGQVDHNPADGATVLAHKVFLMQARAELTRQDSEFAALSHFAQMEIHSE